MFTYRAKQDLFQHPKWRASSRDDTARGSQRGPLLIRRTGNFPSSGRSTSLNVSSFLLRCPATTLVASIRREAAGFRGRTDIGRQMPAGISLSFTQSFCENLQLLWGRLLWAYVNLLLSRCVRSSVGSRYTWFDLYPSQEPAALLG